MSSLASPDPRMHAASWASVTGVQRRGSDGFDEMWWNFHMSFFDAAFFETANWDPKVISSLDNRAPISLVACLPFLRPIAVLPLFHAPQELNRRKEVPLYPSTLETPLRRDITRKATSSLPAAPHPHSPQSATQTPPSKFYHFGLCPYRTSILS